MGRAARVLAAALSRLRAAALLTALAGEAAAECRLALMLAIDVSGSVDGREYRQQLDGIAAALQAPDVQEALLALPEAPVAVMVFEWSGADYQRQIVPWTRLSGAADIAAVAGAMRSTRRVPAPHTTGIGAAMEHAVRQFGTGPDCWARTLDISGDGVNNDFPEPRRVRAGGRMAGITINGLVVGRAPDTYDPRQLSVDELTDYFEASVIRGPGSFVETAYGYGDYARAMTRKLLREVGGMAIGALPGRLAPAGTARAEARP